MSLPLALVLTLPLAPPIPDDPQWISHRGNSWIAPENTLASVRSALALDPPPDFVEIDVYLTADGELAVIHDSDLERTTDRSGRVAEMKWESVRAADAGFADRFGDHYAGERVPSLDEVLDLVKDTSTSVMIEVKAHGAGGPTARRVLERGETERHVLASFHADVIVDASLAVPALRTLYLVSNPGPEHVELARRCGASILGSGQGAANATLRELTRAAQLELWTWTVDDPFRVDQLRALPVDGIISNRVGLLQTGWLQNGVCAHRGNSGHHAENTLRSLASGIREGADWLELDVFRCASGELVVTHDANMRRVSGVDLAVADATLAQLLELDVATDFRRRKALTEAEVPIARIPTLEQALQLVMTQRRTRVTIQPKDDSVEDCIALVHRIGAEPWVGFNDGNLVKMRRVKELAPALPVRWTADATEENVRIAAEHGFETIMIPPDLVTAEKVARLRAAGIEPGASTTNDQARLRELLELSVERIYTDEPALLLRLRTLMAR